MIGPFVNDDFGDVTVVSAALIGDGFSLAQLIVAFLGFRTGLIVGLHVPLTMVITVIAIAIAFGLAFATVFSLARAPVLHATVFRITRPVGPAEPVVAGWSDALARTSERGAVPVTAGDAATPPTPSAARREPETGASRTRRSRPRA